MLIHLLISLICLLPFSSCQKAETTKSTKPTVLVSLPPYIYFVDKIAQGAVDIETLVPAGANPHIYEAAPKEVQRHQSAALWIYLGESFDKKALKFFQNTHAQIQILNVAEGIELLSYCTEHKTHSHCQHHCHDDGHDLHIWLSPVLAKQQAQKIAEALIALLPEKKEEFTANLQIFLEELNHLDEQITALLTPMKDSAILVSHPAFAYFCRDYHLMQLSIEIEGKDPLPQHVTEILAQAKRHQVRSVLTEPQYSNKGAELIAESLQLPTHMVDPYAVDYPENLLKIAQVIVE